jgi:hypothetical protein
VRFRIHARLSAVATAVSCALHLAMIGKHGGWVISALMVVMVAFCLPCVLHLWRSATLHATRRVTTAALVMVALHLVILCAGGAADHAHTGAYASIDVAPTSAHLAMFGVMAVELATAMTASTLTGRLLSVTRRPSAGKGWRPGPATPSLRGMKPWSVSASSAR